MSLRCREIRNDRFVGNFVRSLAVKEFREVVDMSVLDFDLQYRPLCDKIVIDN